MRRFLAGLAMALLASSSAAAADRPDPVPAALIAANTSTLSYAGGRLAGPGADVLRRATDGAQFVLLGEEHYDREIPLLAGALYRMLHDERGFRHLVVEQEGTAMEEATRPGARGDARRIGDAARRYPYTFEFSSDQDLGLLAQVGRTESNPDPIWGIEQTTGAARSLEELQTLAPTPRLKALVSAALAEARTGEDIAHFPPKYLPAPTTLKRLQDLKAAFGARPGSRADVLLTNLVKSAEIYSYYVRAEAGEPVGLYNNTVREAWFKTNFMRHYRAAQARGEAIPKAMFKFGDWHMYHGLGPSGAFTIGNMVTELAITNDMHAVGIQLVAPDTAADWKDISPEQKALLPAAYPTEPTLVDLRPLRVYGKLLRDRAPADKQWLVRLLLNGYDFILVIPNSGPATTTMSGLKLPG
jgi:hypothetical protein